MNNQLIPNKVYDVLKWVAILLLPSIAKFYGNVAGIWGLPYAEQIPATIISLQVLLGAILGVSSLNYKRGGGEE